MLQATPALKEVCLEMHRHPEIWDARKRMRGMREKPSLYADCKSYNDYYGMVFEIAMRSCLASFANNPRFLIAPCVGDYQPSFGNTLSGNCVENFGRVFLSGTREDNRKREYDSVVLLKDNKSAVFEATISGQGALKKIDIADIERRLEPLRRRLGRDFEYVLVCSKYTLNESLYSTRVAVRNFKSSGGLIVKIPLSLADFCSEVDICVKELGFPVYKSVQSSIGIASWDYLKTKERKKQPKSWRNKDDRPHEKKGLEILEQRLDRVSHSH